MVRINGLASGMDIDALVSSMMQAARVPLDTQEQKKQYAEWQRDDYREINKLLLELDTLIKDGVGMQKSFIKKTVSVSDPNAISVKNINSTVDFSGTLTVGKLASAATMLSNGAVGVEKATDIIPEAYIGQEIKIETINKDGSLNTFTTKIEDTDTLNSLISKINANSGVTAFYDQNTKQISFTAKNTGAVPTGLTREDGTSVTAEIGLSGTLFTDLLYLDENNIAAVGASRGTAGQNATLNYNGLDIERSNNTFTINGVEITLKQGNTGPVTFSSTSDEDAVLDTVTQFVNKYNEILANIKTKTDETKYRAYQPLTTAQRKDMTEDEIKLWETKAKSGTLRGDSMLTGFLTKMRTSLYTSVGGSNSVNSLSEIGITTTSNYLEGGKLTINEEKLRAAISEDPNKIYDLFMKSGETSGEMGLAKRLRADIKATMTNIQDKAGKATSVNNSTFTIGKLLNSYNTKIDSWQDKLKALETRYYNQFTAMEKAISKANSQSSSLSQYFS
ncbi:flagellar hook-associated protein 2 [Peribacillus butanolivorans]|uniref:flagellar hook-associated protein 2 n=1 Tax=Peribacillus butanolivorans TaxID=421767 RepID=UPI0030C992A1